jgi:hypothetical protein
VKLVAREDLRSPPLSRIFSLWMMPHFRAFFSGSPVKRIGRDRFLRNALIAAGNSGEADLVPPCEALLQDASPLVRGALCLGPVAVDGAPTTCANQPIFNESQPGERTRRSQTGMAAGARSAGNETRDRLNRCD